MLELFILFAAVVGLAYWRVPALVWSGVMLLVLMFVTLLGRSSGFALVIYWTLFAFACVWANVPTLRQRYFTFPLLNRIKQHLPPISNTEREAIEAGNVWWEKDLFCGRPDWQQFLGIKTSKLTVEEQAFLDNEVETLCQMLNDWQILYEKHDLPTEAWDYLKKERFLGMVIPKEYGGRGFSALAHSTVVMKIATRSVSAAVNAMVPNSLGPGELILHYGTKEQKEYYLPRLARGEEIPCFALTALEAGSDAASITDTGVICKGQYLGKEIIGIRLNWSKRYITLAPIATVLGLAIKLYDPENLLGKQEDLGITLCLIPTAHPGVEIGRRHLPLHLAFMNGPTQGHDVFIPLDWIIGGTAMAGQGWRMLMECLSIGRSISLPALSAACGKLAFRRTGAYARLRRQFGLSISHFEGVEEALSQIAGMTYLIEATRILTVSAVDLHVKPAIASAITKYHLTEMARKIIADAMDIHGGHGIQMGPHNYLANAHLAIPISITVEGANILTRNLIIFGQGAIRCHPYVYKEIQLLNLSTSPENSKQFDRLLFSHAGYVVSNIARTIWASFTAGKLLFSPVRGPVARYYRQITRMSCALALLSDVTMMLLGGSLKRREHISARLGDILSQLYLASATLKYYQDNGETATDLEYVKWGVETCLYETQKACDELLNNYPISGLGGFLHWLIFPYGVAYKKPKDKLSHQIVNAMLTPSAFRDRLTQYCFVSKKEQEMTYKLEKAFSQVEVIEPFSKKLQSGIRNGVIPAYEQRAEQLKIAVKKGILTESEAHALSGFETLYKDIIKVDEFSFDLKTCETA